MKFQLKALAAALVLVAALPAHAITDTALSGNSSLVLAVYDTGRNISALFDLGKNYSDFTIAGTTPNSGVTAEGTSFAWNVAAGDYAQAWSLFGSTTNAVYAVVAMDNAGSGAGARGLISTYSAIVNNPTSGQLQTIAQNFDSYVGGNALDSNVTYQNHGTLLSPTGIANGASVSSTGSSYAPNYFGAGKNFNLGPVAVGTVGSDLSVFQYTATTSFAPPTFTAFGNGAKFNLSSAGTLTYSTNPIITNVPEADTWAMMLLGLSVMGAVARRKQA